MREFRFSALDLLDMLDTMRGGWETMENVSHDVMLDLLEQARDVRTVEEAFCLFDEAAYQGANLPSLYWWLGHQYVVANHIWRDLEAWCAQSWCVHER
jgi:hypothetical protein